jgi:RNA polymerase sigma-70 factor (ECF subfamily)
MSVDPSPQPSDDELVAAARRGENAAFDALMRRHERLVYQVVAGFGRGRHDREEALDLCQTVFLKAFRSLGAFRGESSFRTWLLRIAHHEGLNRERTHGRRPAGVELDEAGAEPALVAPPEQESALLERERSGRLARALAGLQGRYRTAIVLRYRDGFAIREIAQVLAVSENLTKNILFRGVRQLRRAVVEGS